MTSVSRKTDQPDVTSLFPATDDRRPLYIQQEWASVGISSQRLVVSQDKKTIATFPLKDISQLVLCGNISLTEPCLRRLCTAGIPIVHMSGTNWLYGITQGQGEKNAFDRYAQFKWCENKENCLKLAKAFITAKGHNQRSLLLRHSAGTTAEYKIMKQLIDTIPQAKTPDELRAIEGQIAAHYFSSFPMMINDDDTRRKFNMHGRNRRPTKDPINALLSYGYGVLTKDIQLALQTEGLEPWWGVLHTPRNGKPALALDLMEEFRPLIVDSAVISLINNNRVTPEDFKKDKEVLLLKPNARKALLREYESRMATTMTHPLFKNKCSWRTAINIQCKELSRLFNGTITAYTGITTR